MATVASRLARRWNEQGGYRELLVLAVPLILSTGSWSILHFVDRMFLSWYDVDCLAASLPGGVMSFSLSAFFLGTATYANTFVAQYNGAGRPERIGPAVWQSIYWSALATAAMLGAIPFARSIFEFARHDPALIELEAQYFAILCVGSGAMVYSNAVSCFFSGRGKTMTVMWVTVGAVAVNIALDYAWIFGRWGFPEWGMAGAAWATVASVMARSVAFTLLFLLHPEHERFGTRRGWRFDRELFGRLMRFGVPSGVQFMLDVLAFAFFVLLVGRIGARELAASNLSFQVNTLAFMPMIGIGIATSTLVGQRQGERNPQLAEKSAWSALHVAWIYMGTVAFFYVATPRIFLEPFAAKADRDEFAILLEIAVPLLRFVAFYSLFDAACIVFSSALKGAGDTRFAMIWSIAVSWSLMVVPTYFTVQMKEGALIASWWCITIAIFTLGLGFLWRFRGGKWKTMRVIEDASAAAGAAVLAEIPAAEPEVAG